MYINTIANNPDMFSKYSGIELPQNIEERKTVISQFANTKKADMQEFNGLIDSLSRKTGTTIEYDATLEEVEKSEDGTEKKTIYDGYYDPINNKIVINSNSPNSLKYALTHELTHFAENKQGFTDYVKELKESTYFKDYIIEKYGTEEDFYNNVYERYYKVYKELDDDNFNKALEAEMIAEINGNFINMDENALRKIDKNDSKMQRIFKAIADFFKQLYYSVNGESDKAFALKMQNKFERLLTAETVENVDATLKYSAIRENGKNIIIIPDNINNVSLTESSKYMLRVFKNLTGDNAILTEYDKKYINVNRRAVNEFLRSEYVSELSEDLKNVVYISGKHLDELLKYSVPSYSYSNTDPKHSKDASKGWEHREIIFEAPDFSGNNKKRRRYEAKMIIRKNEMGEYSHGIIGLKKEGFAKYSMATKETAIINAKPSTDNVPQNDNIVNNNFMQESEKNTENRRLSISNIKETKIIENQLIEDFSKEAKNILEADDETALKNAENRVAVKIFDNTPKVILENVEESQDLPVIINYTKLYLAIREKGVIRGNYHNLGIDIIEKLPEMINNPQAILKLSNGRLNILSNVKTEKGNNGIVSIELNSVKDISNKYDKYNVVVTVFASDENYIENLTAKEGVTVKYQKEDLSQVNPQLYKRLAIINDKSSFNDSLTYNEKSVKNSISENTIENTNNKKFSVSTIEDSQTFEETENKSDNDLSLKELKHNTIQQAFRDYSIPLNRRTELRELINSALSTLDTGNMPSDKITNLIYEVLDEKSKVIDDSTYKEYKDLKKEVHDTKLHFSEELRRDFPEPNKFKQSCMGVMLLNYNEGRGVDEYYQELCGRYPELFSSEIDNSADQLREIRDVMRSIVKEEMSFSEAGRRDGFDKKFFKDNLKGIYRDYFIKSMDKKISEGEKLMQKQLKMYVEKKLNKPYEKLTQFEINSVMDKVNKDVEKNKQEKREVTVEKILNKYQGDKKILDSAAYIELNEGALEYMLEIYLVVIYNKYIII